MHKKKEIITDYQKQVQELNDAVIRTRTRYLNQIKKRIISHLIRTGECEFEALELLEKLNDFSITCHKCGSAVKCVKCEKISMILSLMMSKVLYRKQFQ